jgi:hypothetical protein
MPGGSGSGDGRSAGAGSSGNSGGGNGGNAAGGEGLGGNQQGDGQGGGGSQTAGNGRGGSGSGQGAGAEGEGQGGQGGEGSRQAAGGNGDGSGDDPFGTEDGTGLGGDEEFDESLGDFDREMDKERERIAAEGGGPAADSTVARQGEGIGGVAEVGGSAESGEPGSGGVRDLGPDTTTVATVQGCNDQDRVARQLCEAATQEQDPFLRAALWDEYNEYKKLVARD